MTESQMTRKLIASLKRMHPQAVIIKHSDRFTSGVPDLSITKDGVTTWIECKKLTPDFLANLDLLQLNTMLKLERQGTAYYVFFEPSVRYVLPSVVRYWHERQEAQQEENGRKKKKKNKVGERGKTALHSAPGQVCL
jgi:hypothetical protein